MLHVRVRWAVNPFSPGIGEYLSTDITEVQLGASMDFLTNPFKVEGQRGHSYPESDWLGASIIPHIVPIHGYLQWSFQSHDVSCRSMCVSGHR